MINMKERIYLDNAATTKLNPEVLAAMMPYLTDYFGNPSSIYSYGRETRMAIEQARKSVAKSVQAHPSEIFFTSGGTESSNTAILSAIRDLGCKRIVSSKIEHHATLHTIQHYHTQGLVELSYVALLSDGHIDLNDLETILSQSKEKCLVTLMHGNNEIGNLLNLKAVAALCEKYGAIFHSDTVQTLGHYPINLKELNIHFITGASHKFHGPKGVGMLYVNQSIKIQPFLHGGAQERNMRSGTENVYGIVGFAKALELAERNYEIDRPNIYSLKKYLQQQLLSHIDGVSFNGDVVDGLYTVLSVNFPLTDKSEMLLFNLDINHICASGGSACSSGADVGSHVIAALYPPEKANFVTVRFSFSKHNTTAEIDQVVSLLKTMI